MRPVKIFGMLLALWTLATQPVHGEELNSPARRGIVERIFALSETGDFAAAIALARELAEGPHAHPMAFALLGALHAERGDDPAIVESWYHKATTALPDDVEMRLQHCLSQVSARMFDEAIRSLREVIGNPRYATRIGAMQSLLGDAYEGAGRTSEALCARAHALLDDPTQPSYWSPLEPPNELPADVTQTLETCGVGDVALFRSVIAHRSPASWTEAELDERVALFLEYAANLEFSGSGVAAERFRTLAAKAAIWHALRTIRAENVARTVELFALAEHAAPLSNLPGDFRVSALRDMMIAYGRSGRLAHAVTAFERLVDDCLQLDKSGDGCPVEGAIVPMHIDRIQEDIGIAAGWQINIFHAGLLMQRLLASVSFDPVTGLPYYKDGHDFVGEAINEHADESGAAARSYGLTSAEEDRVTLQSEDPETYRQRALDDARNGRYELLVKKWLADLCLLLSVGIPAADEPDGEVLGFPINEVFAAVERNPDGSIPEPTRQATRLAHRILKKLAAVPRSAAP